MQYLSRAVEFLKKSENIEVLKISSVYETKPFGFEKQDNFLNAVVEIRTDFELKELFNFIKNSEKTLGRTESFKWGPREIDLDLLFYDNMAFSDENITIPHPEIVNRDFVLVPMNEIEPNFIHTELKEKISDICKRHKGKTVIRKLSQRL